MPVNFRAAVNSLRFTSAQIEAPATLPIERTMIAVRCPMRHPQNPQQAVLRDIARLGLDRHDVYKSYLPRERRNSFTLPSTEVDDSGISPAVLSRTYHLFGQTMQQGATFLQRLTLPPAPLGPQDMERAENFGFENLLDLKFAMNTRGLGHVIFGSKPFIYLDPHEPGYNALRKLKEDGNLNTDKFMLVEHDGSIGLISKKEQGFPALVNKYRTFLLAAMNLPDDTTNDFIVQSLLANIPAVLAINNPSMKVLLGVLLGLGKDSAFAWTRDEEEIDESGGDGFEEMNQFVEELQEQLSTEDFLLPSLPLLTMDKGPEAKQLADNYSIESELLVTRWKLLGCSPVSDSPEEMKAIQDQLRSQRGTEFAIDTLAGFGLTKKATYISGADALRELTT